MKKLIITILLAFLISILFSSLANAYFRDSFWECTRSGEQSQGDAFGRFSPSLQPSGICTKSCCILCVSRSPIKDCFGSSAKPMCSCAQGASTDSTVPELTVNTPVQNNIYDKRAVDFNLQVSEQVKLEWLDNNHPERGYKRLCSRCYQYNRKISLQEGSNDITIRATDSSNNVDQETRQFKVDSKKPKISKSEPKKYGNGEFTIEYNEENLVSLTIFYRSSQSQEYQSITTNNCQSGPKESCTINIPNLQNWDLYYYPEIKDIAQRTAAFREQKITIDTISPEINLDQSLTNQQLTFSKRLPLKLSVSEKATLKYQDLNDIRSKQKTLCVNCNSYDRLISFKTGVHNLKLTAEDNAGNTDEQSLIFNIV